jgi:hypothetical protein
MARYSHSPFLTMGKKIATIEQVLLCLALIFTSLLSVFALPLHSSENRDGAPNHCTGGKHQTLAGRAFYLVKTPNLIKAAEEPGLIGVTNGEASALARQIYGIQVNGESAVSSVEAFGSRAGGTFRGSGGLSATSDLDIIVT